VTEEKIPATRVAALLRPTQQLIVQIATIWQMFHSLAEALQLGRNLMLLVDRGL
jgi:hypothetical protein